MKIKKFLRYIKDYSSSIEEKSTCILVILLNGKNSRIAKYSDEVHYCNLNKNLCLKKDDLIFNVKVGFDDTFYVTIYIKDKTTRLLLMRMTFRKKSLIIMAMRCQKEDTIEPFIDFLIENNDGFAEKYNKLEIPDINALRLKEAIRYYNIRSIEKVEYLKNSIRIYTKKHLWKINFSVIYATDFKRTLL